MSIGVTDRFRLFSKLDLPEAEICPFARGAAAIYTTRCPGREEPNEDAVALIHCGDSSGVLAVADGFGGQPAGGQAAMLALETLAAALDESLRAGAPLRAGILDGFEKAYAAIEARNVANVLLLVRRGKDFVYSLLELAKYQDKGAPASRGR